MSRSPCPTGTWRGGRRVAEQSDETRRGVARPARVLPVPQRHQRDVVMHLVHADMLHQVADNAVLDLLGGAGAVFFRALTQALDAEELAGRAFGLGHAVRIE